ncbi:hypothetical protein WMO40_20820 [Bacillaceae bacterium CLA-AA-H227]|uniref:Uncharacterized protein n=2 Tax=Robertmurraya TaxID=2837507 RepID=A0A4U1D0L2_9BACI|nr:hypothetical protein [Robertmurraya kyonggiensis]TKC15193.1 hypothetical protein FA727_20135 [Robertmurraya kyonggiensis]
MKTTLLLKMGAVVEGTKSNVVSKVKGFLKEETSAKGSSEEGYLVYGGIVIGIIVLGIAVVFMKDGFSDIGTFFNDGVNGTNTNPAGWGSN